jgi:hypothetical protein
MTAATICGLVKSKSSGGEGIEESMIGRKDMFDCGTEVIKKRKEKGRRGQN